MTPGSPLTVNLETQDRERLLQTTRRLLTEVQALSSRIAAVNEIATAINQSLKLDEILAVIGKQAKWVLDFDQCSIYLQEREGEDRLEPLFGPPLSIDVDTLSAGEPLRRVLDSGYPQLVRNAGADTALSVYPSQLIVSLQVGRYRRGVIIFAASEPDVYTQEDLRIGKLLALQLEAALRNAYSFAELNRLNSELEQEKRKSDTLLRNILPEEIAEELKETGEVEPVNYDSATVMFTDFKGFTAVAEQMEPGHLVDELHACFSRFDEIIEAYDLEKLKTIGDSYMCTGGIPIRSDTHAYNAVRAGLAMRDFIRSRRRKKRAAGKPYWEIRIGIHSGPLVAGVIGQQKFAYDVWGETVNLAAAVESAGVPGQVTISQSTFELVGDAFICDPHGPLTTKSQHSIDAYLVRSVRESDAQ